MDTSYYHLNLVTESGICVNKANLKQQDIWCAFFRSSTMFHHQVDAHLLFLYTCRKAEISYIILHYKLERSMSLRSML